MRKPVALAASALVLVLSLERAAYAACAEEAQRATSGDIPDIVRLAECATAANDIDGAIAALERVRNSATASTYDIASAGARIEQLRRRIPAIADDAVDRLLAEAEAAHARGDVSAARQLAERALALAPTEDQIARIANLVRHGTIPSFMLEASLETNVLGFIGSGSSFTTERFFNTTNALDYSVAPIVLGGVAVRGRSLNRAGWERVGLRLDYQTDRLFRSGGSIDTSSSLAQQLGVSGVTADIIDGAVALSGVGFEAEHARFTNGTVRRIDVRTNTAAEAAPLKFTRTRLEATMNVTRYLSTNETPRLEGQRSAIQLHALYYRLGLPRIAYLTQVEPTTTSTIVVAESEPQTIDVGFGAGGASGRLATGGDWGSVGASLTLMFGGGRVGFNMPARLGEPAGPGNRTHLSQPTFAVVSRLGVQGEVRLVGHEYALFLGGALSGEQYYANAQVPGSVAGSVGFADAFYTAMLTSTLRYRYGQAEKQ